MRGLSRTALPVKISGRTFLARAGGVDDALSTIEPAKTYAVRAGVSFPVEEKFRSESAVALLRGLKPGCREEKLRLLGDLLYQSHAGYSSIGLGCPETDQMVAAVRALGPKRGFYGARVSGGGSGGTVVVLLRRASLARPAASACGPIEIHAGLHCHFFSDWPPRASNEPHGPARRIRIPFW